MLSFKRYITEKITKIPFYDYSPGGYEKDTVLIGLINPSSKEELFNFAKKMSGNKVKFIIGIPDKTIYVFDPHGAIHGGVAEGNGYTGRDYLRCSIKFNRKYTIVELQDPTNTTNLLRKISKVFRDILDEPNTRVVRIIGG